MIVIYIIVAVIGSFICTLIKVKIDEWLDAPSMKRSRLSLNRVRHNAAHTTTVDETVDISDDDSFDSLPNPRVNVQQEKHSSITSRTTDVSSDTIRVPNLEACTASTSQQQQMPDLSDDTSNDEDVVTNELPNKKISNRSQSMFSWNKTSFTNKWFQNSLFLEDNTPHSSRFNEQPEEARIKKQKLMDDSSLSDINLEDFEEEASPPQVTIQYEKMIGGIKVKFPVDPYISQIGIVNSIILGCKKKQNCLLESPTGSGKTLALLCGALAWQDYYSGEILKENNGKDIESPSCADDDSLGENFFLNLSQYCNEESFESFSDEVLKNHRPRRMPKIFYGTRTHKQIEQVVRELKKTAYRDKSREHSCIQNTNRNKTELCNELLDPKKFKGCPYYNEKNKKAISSFYALENYGLETPWDIEDLVSLGRNIAACPYFAARSLMAEAEIIFCPYNYILDPNIRESMKINLKDNVVILDEAHNVEDICRDVASVNLRDDELNNAAKECQNLSFDRVPARDAYTTIHNYLADVEKFLNNIDVKDDGNLGQMASDYFPGSYFLQMLNVNKVGSSRFPGFLAASKAAILNFEKMKEESRPEKMLPTISRETKTILEHLCFIMQILTSEASVDDYRAHIIETVEPRKKSVSENRRITTKNCKVRTMKLICMNPAIVFAPLACTVRSVILASGTLTPMSSFESELGTKFPYRPNLKHVVTKEQMYVRCIPRGPNKKPLLAKFTTVNSFDFQDELGELVHQVCKAVPYGVLCFFSSYSVMNKILTRWKNIKILEEISALKQVFVEPQMNCDLPEIMEEYREVIKKSSSSISFTQPSGAILFAVFRGKVAEGIDFKDNEARCVLAIGIPYTNSKSASVSMKMEYNDRNQSKGLLRGSEWYTVNAFRALNQALGRCIRHKDDWGAVLLVDERFRQKYNTNYLPNWIKSMWLGNDNYDLRVELEDFVALQVARERGKEHKDHKEACNSM
ncbi:Fanconi anemia group J protein homolog isoform X2 [Ooceraea biroi]|uniref:Fanconi anemia group J protein homolog isoform X2 n=1 Tax=Ooceraea biroi TaxID=2015173 RepID=UPI0005BC48D8|nr:Fanconi anemia group J protein homolog isoform X2 [Ooceraea biroi]